MVARGDEVMREKFWDSLYRVNAADAFINGGWTEDGDSATCDACGDEMRFDEEDRVWRCVSCGNWMNRAKWFNHIGANPPGKKCLLLCRENYPLCKRWCRWYKIDPNDPIL